jgi:hypothetical protein
MRGFQRSAKEDLVQFNKSTLMLAGTAAVGLAMVSATAGAMLMASREPVPSKEISRPVNVAPADSSNHLITVEAPIQPAPAFEPAARPIATPQAPKTEAARTSTPAAIAPETLNARATVTNAPLEEVPVVREPAPVTITGCLDQDDDKFKLKDTIGADAPKSRSWKSGFLRKRAASLEVVDAGNKLRLPNYVGNSVSVTGIIVDREMQVHSVRRITASCD